MPEMDRTPRLDRILGAAENIARELGCERVGVDHLQLAILNDADAVPTQVLAKMGLAPMEFASELNQLIRSDAYCNPPSRATRLNEEVHRPTA